MIYKNLKTHAVAQLHDCFYQMMAGMASDVNFAFKRLGTDKFSKKDKDLLIKFVKWLYIRFPNWNRTHLIELEAEIIEAFARTKRG